MIMDPSLRGFSRATNGTQLRIEPVSDLSNQSSDPSFNGFSSNPKPNKVNPNLNGNHQADSPEDCDFSDEVLRYIQMLMEEDVDDNIYTLQDSLDLQAAERSFYEVLGSKYPPTESNGYSIISRNGENQNDNVSSNCSTSSCLDDNGCVLQNRSYYNFFQPKSISAPSVNGILDFSSKNFRIPDWNNESLPVSQFTMGIEEASKFLPSVNDLLRNIEVSRFYHEEPKPRFSKVAIKEERKGDGMVSLGGRRGRKNPYRDDGYVEDERSVKQPAIYAETDMEEQVFDKMLLNSAGEGKKDLWDLCKSLKKAALTNEQNVQSKGGKARGKKRKAKKQVVDLRTLLTDCAQAVAADDRKSANELLKQVRQHSSIFGDGNQRLAHFLANALEARLAGNGSQIYKGLASERKAASNVLKAYHLYLAACPFRKLSNFVSNKTIKDLSTNSSRLHIIDFGIFYGFQWPTLIQRLSWRPGGPPKVRITGIDFPQPGFRPAERIEETGRILATYAKKFNVPFEYKAIAKRWETIRVEELDIDKEELIAVTCFYRGKNLLDETVVRDSPKDVVLRLVKKINPSIFIHGITNGAHCAPFFVTRFREALFHFSSLFDMLDTIVPPEYKERMLIEREVFGKEALNVVACEGWERIERPETYKQWQVRTLRAGFVQQPFDQAIVKAAIGKLRELYHKDFLIDKDGQWLLQGWKGRIIYALSAWKPA